MARYGSCRFAGGGRRARSRRTSRHLACGVVELVPEPPNVNELERAGGAVLAGGTGVESTAGGRGGAGAGDGNAGEGGLPRAPARRAGHGVHGRALDVEQVFHRSTLTLTHASGFSLGFGAESARRDGGFRRARRQRACRRRGRIRSGGARRSSCTERRARDARYDWTYSTDLRASRRRRRGRRTRRRDRPRR